MKPFPQQLLLNQPQRSNQLLAEYYQTHHKNRSYDEAKDDQKKSAYFNEMLAGLPDSGAVLQGVDLGCRGGVLTNTIQGVEWVGLDVDQAAIEVANQRGVPCVWSDFSIGIDLVDRSFDVVMMTEVLEHLPHPPLTVREVHRILKPGGIFIGTVPIDYHWHRRYRVFRGKRLEADPTHIHSFSFTELDAILRHYFQDVSYRPMRGTATRYPRLPYKHFVSDIAWFAKNPIDNPEPWQIKLRN